MSEAERHMIQLERLNQQLAYAVAHAKYWHEHLSGFKLPLQSIEELRKMPFSDAAALIRHGSEMVCVPQREITRIVSLRTSGTTAQRKRVFVTSEDIESTVSYFTTGMCQMCSPGMSAAIFMPDSENGVSRLLSSALMRLGVRSRIFGPIAELELTKKRLCMAPAQVFIGMPAQLRALALSASHLQPSAVLLCADYIPQCTIDTIARIWGCEVFSHYGMTETGYGCAVDCMAHQGMHIRGEDLIVEIIDAQGEPVPEGDEGEIVITTLSRRAMPLIRYRTGDSGALLNTPCVCGSPWPRLIKPRRILPCSDLNIQKLDDLLLSNDSVISYVPIWNKDCLIVELLAPDERAFKIVKDLLHEHWPNLSVHVRAGDPMAMNPAAKRR